MNDTPSPANGPLDWLGLDADPSLVGNPGNPSDASYMAKGDTIRRTVRINNPQGLHMRPAAAFAELARQFESTVIVWYNQRSVNGKSFLDLMLLAAEPFTEVTLEVLGPDAESAMPALADLLAAEHLDDSATGFPTH